LVSNDSQSLKFESLQVGKGGLPPLAFGEPQASDVVIAARQPSWSAHVAAFQEFLGRTEVKGGRVFGLAKSSLAGGQYAMSALRLRCGWERRHLVWKALQALSMGEWIYSAK